MSIIVNTGVCCHHQIEGGVFSTRELAEKFADGISGKYYKREELEVVEVPLDPPLCDVKFTEWGAPCTDIWWY